MTVDDIKRVYEVFLDEVRSSDNLREHQQYFMFNDLICMYSFLKKKKPFIF